MLMDASITIAYKCSSCGSFEFFNISLFELYSTEKKHLACHCGRSNLTAAAQGSPMEIGIRTPCMGCGNEHIFILERKEILHKDINVFYCPSTGMQQCFVGKDEAVRRKVDGVEKELDELIDMFGYDSYFKNTQVMFDSLNRLHDIAEKGNLLCECGGSDIELILLPDRIWLKCERCSAMKIIYAASNEDLKDILSKRHILLMRSMPDKNACKSGPFIRKTDGKQIK